MWRVAVLSALFGLHAHASATAFVGCLAKCEKEECIKEAVKCGFKCDNDEQTNCTSYEEKKDQFIHCIKDECGKSVADCFLVCTVEFGVHVVNDFVKKALVVVKPPPMPPLFPPQPPLPSVPVKPPFLPPLSPLPSAPMVATEVAATEVAATAPIVAATEVAAHAVAAHAVAAHAVMPLVPVAAAPLVAAEFGAMAAFGFGAWKVAKISLGGILGGPAGAAFALMTP